MLEMLLECLGNKTRHQEFENLSLEAEVTDEVELPSPGPTGIYGRLNAVPRTI